MPDTTAPEYRDVYYRSYDGLRLYARDYQLADRSAPVILCMHGLTRNSSDFVEISAELAPDFRMVVVEQRGRGKSQYDTNTDNYNPVVYVQDMFTLLAHLQIDSVILLGTSMGGLMAMMMAASQPQMIRALIINDIGPEVSPVGLARIKSYVGQLQPVRDWSEAAAQCQQINGAAFPHYNQAQWRAFAEKLFRENEEGVLVLAYDPAISASLDEDREAETSASPDLWPLFNMLADIPTLVIRGETSDILAPECLQAMHTAKPDMLSVEIPGVGHAPMLDEIEAVTAIKTFLSTTIQAV